MKLQKYLNKNKLRYTPWAVKNKLSPSTIYRYLNGAGISVGTALMIQKATKGEVTLQDMFATK